MNREEVCNRLGIDESKLDEFIAADMPWHGESQDPEFYEAECATWLVVNGKAEVDRDKVSRTATEASEKLGVARQTLHAWSRMDGFPGRPSYYPIDEIREWDAAKNKRLNQHATQDDAEGKSREKLSVKDRRDLLKLQKEEGLLVEFEVVKRDIQRANSYMIGELNLLPGKVESKLPAGLEANLVQIIRAAIKDTVAECLRIMSEHEGDYKEDGLKVDE